MKLSYTIKMTLRNWNRNRLSTVISLLSLTVGLACATVLILYVLGEHRTSRALGDTEGIYLLKQRDAFYAEGNVMVPDISKSLPLQIADRYPEVESWVVLAPRQQYKWGELKRWDPTVPNIFAVTPGLTELFDLPVEQGDLKRTLEHPNEIAVTRSFARLYFGNEEPMGREVVGVNELWTTGQPVQEEFRYTVTTILDDTKPTPLRYSGFFAMPEGEVTPKPGSQFGSYYGFLKLREGQDPAEFAARVQTDSTIWVDTLSLVSADRMYFDAGHSLGPRTNPNSLVKVSNPSIIYVGLTAALAILLIACFNYVNITMTRASQRIKNMAGQRIMGASRWNVRMQTVLDTAMQVLLAFLLALCLMQLILPAFNGFMNTRIGFASLMEGYNPVVLAALLFVVIVLSSLFVLVKIESGGVLRSFKNPAGNKMRFARTMVIVQFVVSVALVGVSLCVSRQMEFIAKALPASDQIVAINGELPREFVDQARAQVGVEASQTASPIPGSSISNDGFNYNLVYGEPGYFDFYRIGLVEGRLLEPTDDENKIVVNQTFVRRIGWDEPIGKRMNINGEDRTVVGVMEDYRTDNVQNAIQPLAVFMYTMPADEDYYTLMLKVSGNVGLHIDALRELWKQTVPDKPQPEFSTLAQMYLDMNSTEERLRQIVLVFAVVSMALTALGLFGLAWYSVQQRAKEISLRKIHGASITQTVLLLCRHFLGWMLVAVVIALPVTWWLSAEWLKGFVYKDPLSVWVFAATVLIAATVTLATVIFQSWRAATANPVNALKTE